MANKKVTVDSEKLYDLKVNKHLSLHNICQEMNLKRSTVVVWLYKLGLVEKQSRKTGELVEADIRRMYLEENVPVYMIARKYKCSISGLRKFIVRHGFLKPVATVRKRTKRLVIPEQELVDLYVNQKIGDTEIAKRFDVSPFTVYKRRVSLGIKRDYHIRRHDLPKEELRKLYLDDSLTMKKIAEHFGCTLGLVNININRYRLGIGKKKHNLRRRERNAEKRNGGPVKNKHYVMVLVPEHPLANGAGYITRYRQVMEEAIGRQLTLDERVHHIGINNKQDDSIENLAVLASPKDHGSMHTDYMPLVGAYFAGLTPFRPAPYKFSSPAFWAGRWVTEIDLIAEKEARDEANGQLHLSPRDQAVFAEAIANPPEPNEKLKAAMRHWEEKMQPRIDAIEKSERITAEDLAVTINAR